MPRWRTTHRAEIRRPRARGPVTLELMLVAGELVDSEGIAWFRSDGDDWRYMRATVDPIERSTVRGVGGRPYRGHGHDLKIRLTKEERAEIDRAAGDLAASAWGRERLLAAARTGKR